MQIAVVLKMLRTERTSALRSDGLLSAFEIR